MLLKSCDINEKRVLKFCDVCGKDGQPFELKVGAVPATMGGKDFLPEGLGYGVAYAICWDCENKGWRIPENAHGGHILFKNINSKHRLVVNYSEERRV